MPSTSTPRRSCSAPTARSASSADFIFYNQPAAADGSVIHKGDNRSGEGDGDDERSPSTSPPSARMLSASSSWSRSTRPTSPPPELRPGARRLLPGRQPGERHRDRPLRPERGRGARDLHDLLGAVPHNGEWKFKAVGQGYATGLAGIAGGLRRPARLSTRRPLERETRPMSMQLTPPETAASTPAGTERAGGTATSSRPTTPPAWFRCRPNASRRSTPRPAPSSAEVSAMSPFSPEYSSKIDGINRLGGQQTGGLRQHLQPAARAVIDVAGRCEEVRQQRPGAGRLNAR